MYLLQHEACFGRQTGSTGINEPVLMVLATDQARVVWSLTSVAFWPSSRGAHVEINIVAWDTPTPSYQFLQSSSRTSQPHLLVQWCSGHTRSWREPTMVFQFLPGPQDISSIFPQGTDILLTSHTSYS